MVGRLNECCISLQTLEWNILSEIISWLLFHWISEGDVKCGCNFSWQRTSKSKRYFNSGHCLYSLPASPYFTVPKLYPICGLPESTWMQHYACSKYSMHSKDSQMFLHLNLRIPIRQVLNKDEENVCFYISLSGSKNSRSKLPKCWQTKIFNLFTSLSGPLPLFLCHIYKEKKSKRSFGLKGQL